MARLAVVRPLIFGGRGAAAMISRFDRNDALHVRKDAFDAPEAAACKHRGGALGFDGGVGNGGGGLDDAFGLRGRPLRSEGRRLGKEWFRPVKTWCWPAK